MTAGSEDTVRAVRRNDRIVDGTQKSAFRRATGVLTSRSQGRADFECRIANVNSPTSERKLNATWLNIYRGNSRYCFRVKEAREASATKPTPT